MRIALASKRDLPVREVDDLPLHRALRARGAEVLTPAWDDPDFDWERCDAVLIRTTWDYHLSAARCAAFVAWARRIAARTRLFHPAEVLAWNVHKSYLHDLQRRGAPVVPTVWLERGQRVDLAGICADRGWARAFVKPMVGAAARETLRFWTDPAGLRAAQAHLDRLLPDEDLMLQPYLDAVETEGELSLVWIDGAASHGVRKIPVPGDYRVQDDFGARDEPHRFDADELRLATDILGLAAREVGGEPLLYARVDFLRGPAGELWLNELELVEPSLFFRHGPAAGERLAAGLLARIEGRPADADA
jgi:hypothetical protein